MNVPTAWGREFFPNQPLNIWQETQNDSKSSGTMSLEKQRTPFRHVLVEGIAK
jgi:hypothetical protein